MEIPLKLGIKLSYDPAIRISGISIPTIIEKDTYIPIFIAALFTIARGWMQFTNPNEETVLRVPGRSSSKPPRLSKTENRGNCPRQEQPKVT